MSRQQPQAVLARMGMLNVGIEQASTDHVSRSLAVDEDAACSNEGRRLECQLN